MNIIWNLFLKQYKHCNLIMSIFLSSPNFPTEKYEFKRDIFEPYNVFISRIKFVLVALDNSIPLQKAIALSFAYRNKEIYGIKYQQDIEEQISIIMNI